MKYKYLTSQDALNIESIVKEVQTRLKNGQTEEVLLDLTRLIKETNLMLWNLMEDLGKTPPFNE